MGKNRIRGGLLVLGCGFATLCAVYLVLNRHPTPEARIDFLVASFKECETLEICHYPHIHTRTIRKQSTVRQVEKVLDLSAAQPFELPGKIAAGPPILVSVNAKNRSLVKFRIFLNLLAIDDGERTDWYDIHSFEAAEYLAMLIASGEE